MEASVEQLKSQLAEEVKKREQAEKNADKWFDEAKGNNDSYEQCVSAKKKLKDQLLSALAAIEKHNKDQSRAHPITVDLSALHEHDAKLTATLKLEIKSLRCVKQCYNEAHGNRWWRRWNKFKPIQKAH